MAKTITAYGVYSYDSSPAKGMTGRIFDEGGTSVSASPNLDTSLGPDPQVEGFIDSNNGLRICSTERVTSGTAANTIFNAIDGSNIASPSWSHIDNLYSLVTLGDYVYALDYDNACVVEIDPSNNYAETGKKYTYTTGHSGYTARGQALLAIDGSLYALFAIAKDNDWADYKPSVLVKLTVIADTCITEADINKTKLAKNAFSMAVSDGYIYIASIGGAQANDGYNTGSQIQTADPADLDSIDLIIQAGGSFPYEFRDISFDGDKAYILAGAYDSNWDLTGKLVSTDDFQSFTTIDDFTSGAEGFYWAAQYISDNNRIFYARGNEIKVLDASDDSVKATLDMDDLGEDYTNLDAMSYVGVDTSAARTASKTISVPKPIRGYRSPLQASRTQRAVLARQISQGRPELSAAELQQLNAQLHETQL